MQLINLSTYPDRTDDGCITTVLQKTFATPPVHPTQRRAETKSFLDAQELIYERLASQDRIKIDSRDGPHNDFKAPSEMASVVVSSGLRRNAKAPAPTIYSRILLSSGFRERDLLKDYGPAQEARTNPQSHGSAAKDFVEAYLDVGREILFPDNVRRAEAGLENTPSMPATSRDTPFENGEASKAFEPPKTVSWTDIDGKDDGGWYKTWKRKYSNVERSHHYSFLTRDGLKRTLFAPLRASANLMRGHMPVGVTPRSYRADRVAHPDIYELRKMSLRQRTMLLIEQLLDEDFIDDESRFQGLDDDLADWWRTPVVRHVLHARLACREARRVGRMTFASEHFTVYFASTEPGLILFDSVLGLSPELSYDPGLPNDNRLMQRFLPDPPPWINGEIYFRWVDQSTLILATSSANYMAFNREGDSIYEPGLGITEEYASHVRAARVAAIYGEMTGIACDCPGCSSAVA